MERGVPDLFHSQVQNRVQELFYELKRQAPFFIYPELRIPVGPGKYRIADLAVFAGERPRDAVPAETPLAVFEIVSADDRWHDILLKLEDYRRREIRHIWLIDPGVRRGFAYQEGDVRSVTDFQLPEFNVSLRLDDIFS